MNNFDDQLKDALRRVEAPEGFADRVLARARQLPEPAPRRSLSDWFRLPGLQLALAASLCLTVGVGVHLHRLEQERLQGEAAKQQLLQALHITGSKLHSINARVREIGVAD